MFQSLFFSNEHHPVSLAQNSAGVLTDFVSFYTMVSRVLNHPVHKGLKAAHSLYCVSSSTPLPDLMEDTLFLAKSVSVCVSGGQRLSVRVNL